MRKIISGATKDASGAFVKEDKPEVYTPPNVNVSDVSLDDLIKDHLLILYRQTKRLTEESARGLLSKESDVSFERVVKLTRELRKEERDFLKSLSDEDLALLSTNE